MNCQPASRHEWHPPTPARTKRRIIYLQSILTTPYKPLPRGKSLRHNAPTPSHKDNPEENKETREQKTHKNHLAKRVHDRPQQEQPRRPFASTHPPPGYIGETNGTGEEPTPEGRLQLDQRSYRNPLKPR
jgi:hypothetical protein